MSIKVLFVCSGNSQFGIIPFIKNQGESLKKAGINLEYFLIKDKGIIGYLSNIKKLREHLSKNKYDIIHSHYGLSGWVSIFAFPKVPVVTSFMGDDLYGDANKKGKKYFSDFIYIFLNKFQQLFLDFIIVKSKNLAKEVILKKKMEIIPNGVDFALFKPTEKIDAKKKLNFYNNKKYILFLGDKENPRKNFQLLEKALNNVRNIELLAPYPVEYEKIPYLLNFTNVVVMTSLKEGSPNIIKEAMACNCPIVSTDVGDVRWVLGDTEGCYITSFDPKDIADKIEIALKFADNKGRTRGRERIIKLGLDLNSIADKIIEIYKKIITR